VQNCGWVVGGNQVVQPENEMAALSFWGVAGNNAGEQAATALFSIQRLLLRPKLLVCNSTVAGSKINFCYTCTPSW
jgi:hypothetical protein